MTGGGGKACKELPGESRGNCRVNGGRAGSPCPPVPGMAEEGGGDARRHGCNCVRVVQEMSWHQAIVSLERVEKYCGRPVAGTLWGEPSVRAAEAQGTARSESSPHRLEGKTGATLFLDPLQPFHRGRAEARPSPWRAQREGRASARPCGWKMVGWNPRILGLRAGEGGGKIHHAMWYGRNTYYEPGAG